MKQKKDKISRRGFLKTVGTAGAVSAFAGIEKVLASVDLPAFPNEPNAVDPNAPAKEKKSKIPLRKLGKTGCLIPCLSLGANRLDSQLMLRSALQQDITYWDTANSYTGGNSEQTIGKVLSASPQLRKDLFIVTKASRAKEPEDIEKCLKSSLERMNTDYVDLYMYHGLSSGSQLNEGLRKWVVDAKKRKLIRFFGFSTHENMADCLMAASKLDWVDAIMTSYNFRLMQDAQLQQAVEACFKAGVGLVAMKVLGQRLGHKIETDEDKKLVEHFLKKGLTEEQAKIKAVLGDKRISSACVGMSNVTELATNAKAVIDTVELTAEDKQILAGYSRSTCELYCVGCSQICSKASPDMPYIADVMRHLMYYNSYGDHEMARELFAQLPAAAKSRLLTADYSLAEARCPNRLPVAKLIKEAVSKLT